MHDLEASIRIVANHDLLACQGSGDSTGFENEEDFVIAQRQGLRQRASFFPTHGAIKVLMIGQRPVHVLRIARLLAEPRIENPQ